MTTRQSAAQTLPHASWPQALLLLFGSCLPILGSVLVAPVLPRIQQHFADAPGAIVLVPVVLTLPALMIALFSSLAGVLVDRFGRRNMLLVCMAIYTFCGVLPFWLESLPQIVASRAGLGLAEAGIMTVCTTLIGDYYDGERRQRLFSLQAICTSISGAVFLTVGGLLGQDNWRMPFAVYWVGLLLLPLMTWLLWEPRRDGTTVQASVTNEQTQQQFPWRPLIALYAMTLMAGLCLMVVPVQGSYLLNMLGITAPKQIGMTMALNQVGVIIGAGAFRMLSRHPLERMLAGAFLLAGAGLFLMMRAASHQEVLMAVFINGLGVGLMIPVLGTWVMSLAGFAVRGRTAGGFMAAFFGGEFLSPLLVLAITDGAMAQLPTGLGMLSALFVALALTSLFLPIVSALNRNPSVATAPH